MADCVLFLLLLLLLWLLLLLFVLLLFLLWCLINEWCCHCWWCFVIVIWALVQHTTLWYNNNNNNNNDNDDNSNSNNAVHSINDNYAGPWGLCRAAQAARLPSEWPDLALSITVLLLKNCPFVAVVVIVTIITMTTTNKGHFFKQQHSTMDRLLISSPLWLLKLWTPWFWLSWSIIMGMLSLQHRLEQLAWAAFDSDRHAVLQTSDFIRQIELEVTRQATHSDSE